MCGPRMIILSVKTDDTIRDVTKQVNAKLGNSETDYFLRYDGKVLSVGEKVADCEVIVVFSWAHSL